MADNAGATASVTNTPPRNSGLPADLKSTPHAVGSAVVSEYIDTLGVNVSDVRPWIGRDVKNYQQSGADEMLQQLLEMCTDPSQSLPSSQKSTLFDTSLEAVLHLCNGPGVAQNIKQHLTKFCIIESETPSYTDFVQAANYALRGLRKVNVPGIPAFQDDDETNVLFHVNDPSFIHQEHQGKKSSRKPDVVVVSYKSAADIMPEGKSTNVYQSACKKPTKDHENFQWIQVRTTFEFKRPKKRLSHPPSTYNKDYVVPAVLYMDYMKETSASAHPTDSTPATGPAETSYKKSNELQNISERLRSSKRGSDHLGSNELPNIKRSKQDEEGQPRQEQDDDEEDDDEDEKKKEEPRKHHPVVQNGLYVAGDHVISFIVNNDIIYLWWFDRHHTIQCAGINFVQDLPRFVVLLFIMQRMGYKQWGLHPLFEPEPGYEGEIIVECEDKDKGNRDKEGQDKKKRVDLILDLKSKKRMTHFGLRGPLWPEEARQSEPEILEEVYKIAQEDPDVLGHVPEMVWFHKFEGTSTAIIRKALGIDDTGSRALYIIVFRKLDPITTLSGDELLLAWWEVVKCKSPVLFLLFITHSLLQQAIAPSGRGACITRDVSPSNLMGYRLGGRFISVLNDFDLSSIKRFLSSIKDAPKGFERTGTVPFMSLHLLVPEAIAGQVEHVYYHDAESFIWVLTWICLRYENGKLLRKNRPLDEWLTHASNVIAPKNFDVAMQCLAVIHGYTGPFASVPADDDVVFNTWLQNHVPKNVLQGNIS
ncbi:hypothetical protein DFJ58DRAFT_866135 [Suillus subalutaceus]|uniref:uncharacterized protein n=1 Tax=Suillus subalutaceus TaxID=48586 RepID=UPI001B87A97C|nr:uncharacterized protein DFJ58DRAFT_866135 [Suillus subalutaceus]KAG1864943.1 hypothetical protein DFJ58DRAFT_866135 [Suillus subalutaceus]